MNVENINKKGNSPRVLIVPLDWGLGHATRCISIIKILLENGIDVVIAGERDIVKLLENSFPGLVFLPLKGYRVQYSRHKQSFFFKMLFQVPKIVSAIRNENKWVSELVATHQIDAILSDNRFGLYHPDVPTVFITHQLAIQTGHAWLDSIAQKINYRLINRFSECWVPDIPADQGLAGKLSHPATFPKVPVKYLGVLSRFTIIPAEKKYNLLLLLSGPEPQRSIFENILIAQVKNIPGNHVLVRGLPAEENRLSTGNERLTVFNHLPAEALNELILQSRLVVARCGYSTVMDLYTLKQNALLVPTPGQTEQEYLAAHLLHQRLFYTVAQDGFSLQHSAEAAKQFKSETVMDVIGLNKEVIGNWIDALKKKLTVRQ